MMATITHESFTYVNGWPIFKISLEPSHSKLRCSPQNTFYWMTETVASMTKTKGVLHTIQFLPFPNCRDVSHIKENDEH